MRKLTNLNRIQSTKPNQENRIYRLRQTRDGQYLLFLSQKKVPALSYFIIMK